VIGAVNLLIMVMLFHQAAVGHYSVFLSYAVIASTFSVLAYDIALQNVTEEEIPALLLGCLLALLFVLLVLFCMFEMVQTAYSGAILLQVFSLALYKLSEMLNIRQHKTLLMAQFRILPHFIMLGLLVTLVMEGEAVTFLIWLHVWVFFFCALLYAFLSVVPHLALVRWRGVLTQLRQHRHNPLLVSPADFLNTAAYQLPVIVIEHYFHASIAAQYAIVLRFCFAPVNIIGSAIGQVYHGELARVRRLSLSEFQPRFRQINVILWGLGVVIGAVIYAVFPVLYPIFLGDGWEMAGQFTKILSPLFLLMLVVAPLTVTFYVFEKQQYFFYTQLWYFIISAASFGVAVFSNHLIDGVMLFSGLSVIRYLFIYSKVLHLSRVL
jgi:O-antigen/teichoic acid export membrane protein